MVSFHSDKAGPIVGVGSTDQGSKAEHIICEVPFQACCRHMVARLSNRNKATPAAFHSSVYTESVLSWLEEVDERFLLDYYNWHRNDVSGLEKSIHRCHDLVKTPTETSQGHDHVNLQLFFFYLPLEHLKTLGKVSVVLVRSGNKITALLGVVLFDFRPNRIKVPIDEFRQKAFSFSFSEVI